MHPIIRDEQDRFIPVVRPGRWQLASVRRFRDRTDRIARARAEGKKRLTTTQWISELEGTGRTALEASGIPWAAVQCWLDELEPREAFVARMVVKQVLQTLVDDKAALRERFEARNELYRRLIAAGIVD